MEGEDGGLAAVYGSQLFSTGGDWNAYLIFVIFVTQVRFLEPKFYTEKCVNSEKSDFATK